MERQAQEMLERQIESLENYPDLKNKLREHLGETKEQLKRLEKCLTDLDSSPSTVKDMALAFGANVVALANSAAPDAVLKCTFANAGLEAYEIAAYKSLLVMAEKAGARMKTVLQESLREEERMAAWVDKHVQDVTGKFVRDEEAHAA
jgi:ferritin-like metal-binding protein YciE